MTALVQDRKVVQAGAGRFPELLPHPVEANTMIFGGAMVATNAAGNAVPVTANGALKVRGIAEKQINNLTTNAPYGAAGAQTVTVRPGCFGMNSGTGANAITAANIGQAVYASDDNTVNLTDNNGTWPYAGRVEYIEQSGLIYVQLGEPSAYSPDAEVVAPTAAFRARNLGSVGVNVNLVTGYTVNAGNDGVTNVAGDVILLASQATPAQNGPWVVGTPVTNVAPLTRPDWWPTGAVYKTGTQIKLGGEGTVYKNTLWQSMLAADFFTVDTSDPKLYPLSVSGQTALVLGTFTIPVPCLSVKSGVTLDRVAIGGTVTGTVGYFPSVAAGSTGITAGPPGTGQVVVTAQPAAGNATVTADTSTINWTVTNQP